MLRYDPDEVIARCSARCYGCSIAPTTECVPRGLNRLPSEEVVKDTQMARQFSLDISGPQQRTPLAARLLLDRPHFQVDSQTGPKFKSH